MERNTLLYILNLLKLKLITITSDYRRMGKICVILILGYFLKIATKTIHVKCIFILTLESHVFTA